VSVFRRWLREPLLHFLVLGAALFATQAYLQPAGDGAESSKQIALTLDDLRQLDMYFESQWRRPPTPEEFGRLVENKIREEVLYREALAMGLDKDDTIVKRRMAQKMQFLAEDVAGAHEPTTEELKTWYAKNSEKFALPTRATFRHLYFSFDRRGRRARDDAAAALEKLAGKPEDSKLASSLADPFMFQDYYGDRASGELAKEFGPTFAQGLFQLKPGSWQGPIESGYGWHLVWIESITPGRIPDFEEVEPDVKTAWLGDQKEQAWRKAYAAMRAKYTVLLPVPPDKDSTPAPTPPPKKEVPAPSGEGAL
jgi:peptidyl-prolyl cis-trans isomerase C